MQINTIEFYKYIIKNRGICKVPLSLDNSCNGKCRLESEHGMCYIESALSKAEEILQLRGKKLKRILND